MIDIEIIKERLNEMLREKRLMHSINVAKCAVKLSEIYNVDTNKAYIAGLVHDCAKNLNEEDYNMYIEKYNIELEQFEKNNRALSHSLVGSFIAKYEFKIEDEDIINSIKHHTTGKADMSVLEKIIYIADLIEDGRNFPSVDVLRAVAFNVGLDECLLQSFNNTIKFILDKNQFIHPRTIEARNYIILNIKK